MGAGKTDGKRGRVRRDEQITAPEVRVVQGGDNLGVMPTPEAVALARDRGLNLVEVAPFADPPVCQVMDYGRYVYNQNKRADKTRPPGEKEVAFRYVTAAHDLETKARQVAAFLGAGHPVKLVVKVRGRYNAHMDLGYAAARRMLSMVGGVVVSKPRADNGDIVARVRPPEDKP